MAPNRLRRSSFGTNASFGEDHLERDEKQGYPKDLFQHWVGQAGRKLVTQKSPQEETHAYKACDSQVHIPLLVVHPSSQQPDGRHEQRQCRALSFVL